MNFEVCNIFEPLRWKPLILKIVYTVNFRFECIFGKEIFRRWLDEKLGSVYRLYSSHYPEQSFAYIFEIFEKLIIFEKKMKIQFFYGLTSFFIVIFLSASVFHHHKYIYMTRRVEFWILTSRVIRLQGKRPRSKYATIWYF